VPVAIVIESTQPVAIAFKQPCRIILREVFPLQQHTRPALDHGRDETLDKVVILLTTHTLVAPADIERVGQAVGIIGPDIEHDR
jgi:hypothetical protein